MTLLVVIASVGVAGVGAQPASAELEIRVVSNRADLVSGADALVEVVLPAGVEAGDVRVDVDGRDVTDQLRVNAQGRFGGLLDGLALGENAVTATLPDGSGARLTITNSPVGGPVFSGPQIQPWTCVGDAWDAQCNRAPVHEFLYISTDSSRQGFQPYDPENPPDDVAETTTDEGETVPFIVRQETGVMARDEYRIAVLYDPAQQWDPWSPQRGYNHKLVLTHGASCDTHYIMGEAPDVLVEDVLARGFAVASHALDNSGHNCHVVTQAESLMMTKERVAETLGEIRYTIGSGCSGGALAQQWVANAYPGIYQGITPACSFTDSYSNGMQREDYELLRRYFEDPSLWAPGVVWTPAQISQVYDHPNITNPVSYTELIPPTRDPSRECVGVAPEDVYEPETNPDGVRCSIQDYWINVFGESYPGKAGNPADNVGVQYGLRALEEGLLTPAQFVDVNTQIGSHDIDYIHQLIRREAEQPALDRVYRSGGANVATNMDQVAIIDLRGPDPGAFHDVYRTYAMRERLLREHGTADNQVLWRGQVALFGDVTFEVDAIFAMDSWLAAVEADMRDVPLAQKILEDRPETVTDRCTDGSGRDIPAEECDAVVQSYGTPRFQAGMPLADDTIKCELKPHRREDYAVEFTDEQWAALEAVFPTGVCDYTVPGVGTQGTVPWLDYSEVVGGEPMADPPTSAAFGPDGPPPTVQRHAGADRIATAAAISMVGRATADTVVLARAEAFADALAGAPLAVVRNAPLLLTDSASLSPTTRSEIGRLGATRAVLLGGTAAISDDVAVELEGLGMEVERIAGDNRYATATAIAAEVGTGSGELLLASGEVFADALSGSGMAATLGLPILLTTHDALPAETADFLEEEFDVTVVGGSDAVSEQVSDAADAAAGTVTRLGGSDRYATSAAVAEAVLDRGINPTITWVATGRDFPDGLVAAAAAGPDEGLLLLIDGTDPSGAPQSHAVLAEQAAAIRSLQIAGGSAAVSIAVEAALRELIAG